MRVILLIDKDPEFCQHLARFLNKQSFKVEAAHNEKEALEFLNKRPVSLIFLESEAFLSDGNVLFSKLRSIWPEIPVVAMGPYSNIRGVVSAVKQGAFDFLPKPLLPDDVLTILQKILSVHPSGEMPLTAANAEPDFSNASASFSRSSLPGHIAGKSNDSMLIQRQVELVAKTNYSVLINGESGTGKEFVANTVHSLSARHNKPFIAIDCGSLTRELAGSELFGHEKGAFTGALASKAGLFELAQGGTIFLDEIANLPYDVQVSLLRVLQEHKIRRLGSHKEIHLDVRLIAASNEKLRALSGAGKFREDL